MDALIGLARAHSVVGNNEEAIKQYDKVLSIDTGNVKAMKGKAAALTDLGKTEEALNLYKEAVKIDPETNLIVDALSEEVDFWKNFSIISSIIGSVASVISLGWAFMKIKQNKQVRVHDENLMKELSKIKNHLKNSKNNP